MDALDLGAMMLRLLPAEQARQVAMAAIKHGWGPKANAAAYPSLQTNLCGMLLPNPIGLAAGFDKNAEAADRLLEVGFGFVECGTVTPKPQPGNLGKRLFRLPKDRAVINRMGFNSVGLDLFASRLQMRKSRLGTIGANIGANKDGNDPIDDYVTGLKHAWSCSSYIVINISSPNTPGLRSLQEKESLCELLERLREVRQPATALYGYRPLFLKVAPDLSGRAIADVAEVALRTQIDGLIVSNTTIDRPGDLMSKHKDKEGGLSGRPLFAKSTHVLKEFAIATRGKLALVGVGGVHNAWTALAKIKAGATAVQLYTAWAYDPNLMHKILGDLAALLRAEGFTSIGEAIGADLPTASITLSNVA